MAYDDAFAAAPQVTLHDPGLPALRRVRRGRASPAAPELLASPTTTSTRWPRGGIDTLILGCTHYPLLTGVISYVLGDDVTLVSSAEETAKDVYRAARPARARAPARGCPAPAAPLPRRPGSPASSATIGRRFLGPELDLVDQFAWVGV